MTNVPLVSIGMPVYNEDKYIRDSLESLISQDYGNIELIISDNGSTDETQTICQEYTKQSPLIKYYRSDENKGPIYNFNNVLKKASGKYFMWASGHDLWSHNCVSECANVLEENENVVIAFGTTSWIDENGNAHQRQTGWTDTRGMSPFERFFTVLWGNMHPVLGLIRRNHLDDNSFSDSLGTDLILLCKLSLQGDFVHVMDAHCYRREFRIEKEYSDKLSRYKSHDYGLVSSTLSTYLSFIKLPVALINLVITSNLKIFEKLLILVSLLPSLPVRYYAGKTKKY